MGVFKRLFFATNIKSAFYPLMIFAKLNGVAPFNITDDFQTKLSFLCLTYMFCNYIIYMVGCTVSLIRDETITTHMFNSFLFKMSDKFRIIIGLFTINFIYSNCLLKRRFYGKAILKFTEIDKLFESIGIKKNYVYIKKKFILYLSFYECINFFYMFLGIVFVSTLEKKPSVAMNMAMYTPGFIITAILVVFGSHITVLIRNSQLLNDHMSKIVVGHVTFRKRKSKCVKNSISVYDAGVLHHLKGKLYIFMEIHDELCQFADFVGDYFAFCILIVTGISFVCIVLNMFYVLMTIVLMMRSYVNIETYSFLFFSLQQCLTHLSNTLYAIKTCNDMAIQVNCI